MNGVPFTAEEDALILASPQLGPHRLGRMLARAYQSVRTRRETLLRDWAVGTTPRAFSDADVAVLLACGTSTEAARRLGRTRGVCIKKRAALGRPFVRG